MPVPFCHKIQQISYDETEQRMFPTLEWTRNEMNTYKTKNKTFMAEKVDLPDRRSVFGSGFGLLKLRNSDLLSRMRPGDLVLFCCCFHIVNEKVWGLNGEAALTVIQVREP